LLRGQTEKINKIPANTGRSEEGFGFKKQQSVGGEGRQFRFFWGKLARTNVEICRGVTAVPGREKDVGKGKKAMGLQACSASHSHRPRNVSERGRLLSLKRALLKKRGKPQKSQASGLSVDGTGAWLSGSCLKNQKKEGQRNNHKGRGLKGDLKAVEATGQSSLGVERKSGKQKRR